MGDDGSSALVEAVGRAELVERTEPVERTDLVAMLCGVVAEVCELPGCAPDDRFADLGVDSVRAAEAAAVLEDALGFGVPLEAVFAAGTPAGLAELLAKIDDHG
ncbi:phosphopantetheine-binding [Catenulispora acidiphila DSM 44928]|uniref:Phosphopantetheine-binding n=1 Tax=Catenulispora acidiphila (strain DSM 44928 / JCM 14897 / NBRC 102108 / NRRL B-24433 / ID139908) TaxID=479433 RepID=C7Q916_CATAD|nr:acyl carrier protein [Catenulispora acidiphila]ACU72336.1 phosphopantetheine-binding [Catenulispora acidiphila DSM 44928]